MGRCRVAIVDDNEAFAESLALALVIGGGVETRTVQPLDTPEATLAELLAWRADVVVIDIWLAGPWSGATLATVLEGCGTTVVIATASPGVRLPEGCTAAVFDKTAPRRELIDLVLGACPSRSA